MTYDAPPSDPAPELSSTFAAIRAQPAPPVGLTPQSLLRAGQRARQRRRATTAVAGVFSAAAAIALVVGFAFGSADEGPPRNLPAGDVATTSPTSGAPRPSGTSTPSVGSVTPTGLNTTPSNTNGPSVSVSH